MLRTLLFLLLLTSTPWAEAQLKVTGATVACLAQNSTSNETPIYASERTMVKLWIQNSNPIVKTSFFTPGIKPIDGETRFRHQPGRGRYPGFIEVALGETVPGPVRHYLRLPMDFDKQLQFDSLLFRVSPRGASHSPENLSCTVVVQYSGEKSTDGWLRQCRQVCVETHARPGYELRQCLARCR